MIVILMGVSGSGKTTVGLELASRLGWEFIDADDYHPAANVRKMTQGVPLTDEDRQGWLISLRCQIDHWEAQGKNVVLACSALKDKYRDLLAGGMSTLQFVYLKVSQETAVERLTARKGHFMPPSLIISQFDTLEEPADAIAVDAQQPLAKIVENIRSALAI